ncbi:hypothetical protein MMAG44476_15765 [Mycolicibacterium mageritense DSM 44476 = CIP 104973]|uniref:Uncharacterized protein n=1 Tax=Mycolicibacterium mageritense TaxID=53462 RepID=A0AAI8XPD9_MYCME|nr:basic secretory family protein [Mycolicibacterium mageritense]MCC9186673.1 basic secretory family protein [Mycolicibacterium mageritense]BDY32634.1 hypothetical protein hbim_06603 [Mycolicibacterium mageritense]CDO25389.1 hypothetical protein BN978_05895 [Mycolicibacterium mageritense DSM 44476 = CIP 104973]
MWAGPSTQPPPRQTSAAPTVAAPTDARITLSDGRTAQVIALGGPDSAALRDRLRAELDGAAAAVTQFWGADWPREIVIVVTGSAEQFQAMAVSGSDIAAATTAQGVVFAPGAAAMSPDALRIVLRHELFHYAARTRTTADAPRWLTEGVADYVGRPHVPVPAAAADLAVLPTDADLDTPGRVRTLAYDRAWWFSRYVADRYGPHALRELYVRACGAGHPDVATAVRDTLGVGLDEVLAGWRAWMNR